MINGVICDLDKEKEVKLMDCDMAFVVGIRCLVDTDNKAGYVCQNVIIGGGIDRDHIIKCLAENVSSHIQKLGDDNAYETFKLLDQFFNAVKRETVEYLADHVLDILEEKEG